MLELIWSRKFYNLLFLSLLFCSNQSEASSVAENIDPENMTDSNNAFHALAENESLKNRVLALIAPDKPVFLVSLFLASKRLFI